MSFEMKPEIKVVLEKIRFVDRYKKLSENFRGNPNDLNDRLEDYDIEKVNEIFKRLGYVSTFDKKEKFFKVGVIDNSPNYMIWFNIILEYGMTEFIWVVYHNDEVRLGSPWSVYSRLLINPRERIKKPVYRSYEELEDILKEAFLMYDDFKSELISVYSKQ
ncbi:MULTISPECIES: hypothetical protein [Bacillus]|uniref:Uncharacterized protein n=2 Tax=Bacillus cereus group TaxID=86661 RepID=A0A9X7C180_BACTU|nr:MULTISPECIES: hypothetical protein [Bacillus]PFB79244.1 hypothetical protein CN286_13580 [Bacillus anthracis]ALC53268.1 hypothetical protein ACN91_17310 [Bacillus cereus]AQY39793.1 hypothetical protein B4918_18420 [Bacillus thuringiensis]AWC28968.1 hypothetical protein CG483_011900 [Bacillus cytotoxicus]AWC39646.1 hypothetical protein CG480_003350 [Bacillus cytotoxicus]